MTDPSFKVDLSNCDREPIHILGAIQPFGFLIVLSSDWNIVRVSANSELLLGLTPDALIGRHIVGVFAAEAVHSIRNRMFNLVTVDVVERIFKLPLFDDERLFDLAIHMSNGQFIFEVEPASTDSISLTATLRSMMSRLDGARGMSDFFREGARQVRVLTGFDRVMVYRFDESESGHVVAESARSGIGSFLGLHYPASDIPVQARALYVRNLFRVIADVRAKPVAIVPQLDENGAPLDLSLAVTRAVSPIHIEYLTNMGVAASLSISVVLDGKLWGLFACHHYTPRLPGLERRSLAELFGQMFAMKLESRERQLMSDFQARTREVSSSLLGALANDAKLLEDPGWLGDTLNRAIESDGMGVSINGRVALAGLAPSESEFAQIIKALNGVASSKVYATDRIADLLPAAEHWSGTATGMLSMPISRSPRDHIVLFRQEMIRTVRWGGDPHKPVEFGPNGPRLTPRKSFENWSELVKGRSKPFSLQETNAAEMLRTTLIEVVLRFSEETNTERQLAASRQELLIAELNHRVRNILSLIGGLVRRTKGSAANFDDYVEQIDSRINALARAHNQITQQHWGAAPLRSLIENETGAYFVGKLNHVSFSGPDVLLAPLAYSTLALVLHELLTNASKYGGLAEHGRVHLIWRLDAAGDLFIDWRESGGPAVQAPIRQGFGSTIINRSIPYDLGGNAEVLFKLTGLEAKFCIPARFVTIDRFPASTRSTLLSPVEVTATDQQVLLGETVLLVEDSLIIALDTEQVLKDLGADRVLSASNVQQALALIEDEQPSVAVLDLNLGDQTAIPVALRLLELGIRFVFATGYGDKADLPQELLGAPILQKPYSKESIASAIGRLAH